MIFDRGLVYFVAWATVGWLGMVVVGTLQFWEAVLEARVAAVGALKEREGGDVLINII